MSDFQLVSGLAKKAFVCDLPLCSILMETKEEFPWIFLVPRRANIVQINQLTPTDQIQLLHEMDIAQNIMEKMFPCDRLNVAAIGNMTPQLHVHIIVRTKEDKYWPDVVWNKPMTDMTPKSIADRLEKIQTAFKGAQ